MPNTLFKMKKHTAVCRCFLPKSMLIVQLYFSGCFANSAHSQYHHESTKRIIHENQRKKSCKVTVLNKHRTQG